MNNHSAPVCAAIDVGSNTIHIVIARCFKDTLQIVADEQEMVRIGESVTATGAISPVKCQIAIATLQKYQALAVQHQAKHIFVVATEAIRQASNSAEFITTVKEQTDLEIQLISGVAEAALMFFGATYEAGPQKQIGVMDLGGGSLELALAHDMQITWCTSFPIGSGWLHDRYLSGDPPTASEIAMAEAFLHDSFQNVPIKLRPPTLIVTGGSANSLFRLAQEAFHRSPAPRRLTVEDLTRCRELLSTLESADITKRYKQSLARARLMLAGTLIITHIMRLLQLPEILVSSHGIREGVLLAYARYGDNWLREASKELAINEE
jgi:exopolyphosphatase / guanosine-5'-triphosphate,3'-diphosphate pyrophosphatase